MGDDEFTQGRPHPMIDPSLRDARIREEIADPTTAVVLFDVVLGYGSAADPTAGLLGVIGCARPRPGGGPARRVHRLRMRNRPGPAEPAPGSSPALKSAGVLVASSNAEAAAWSAALISERKGANA